MIPPNVNEENLADLYDRSTKEMQEANITKKTNLFEVNEKSDKGINIDSELISNVLNVNEAYQKYAKGYGKLEVEGKYSDGSLFKFNSEEDALYQSQLPERDKNNIDKLIEYGNKGILIFYTKKTTDKYQ